MGNEIEKAELAGTAEWFDDRYYKIKQGDDFVYVASVTTKLSIEAKPALYKWYAELGWDQAKRKMNEAGDRGTRIHYAVYVYLMGGVVIYNPWRTPKYTPEQIEELKTKHNGLVSVLQQQDEMVAVWKVQQFFDIVKPKIKHLEETVYSLNDGIAGTLDAALEIKAGTYPVNGAKGLVIPETGIYIVDYKTGNAIYESAWAQMAAYSKAYSVMKQGNPKGAIILHTSSSNKKGVEGLASVLKTTNDLNVHYQIFERLSFIYEARNPGKGPKAFEFPTIIKRGENNVME